MSDLVGNPEDRFSRVEAQFQQQHNETRLITLVELVLGNA